VGARGAAPHPAAAATMRGAGRRGQKQGNKNNDGARPVRAWGDPSRHAPRVADGGGAGSAVVHILRLHARAVLVSQQADYRRGCAGAAPLRHAIHRLVARALTRGVWWMKKREKPASTRKKTKKTAGVQRRKAGWHPWVIKKKSSQDKGR